MPELMIETRKPARPEEVVGRFPALDRAGLEEAIAAAVRAQPEWASLAPRRAAALNHWAASVEAEAEPLAMLVAREVGKPISEARGEVARTVAILRYYAQVALDPIGETYPSPDGRASLSVERRQLGTVALVCPWNFPLAIPAWKLAPALAVGNTVLLKPSSAALATATRLVELGQPHPGPRISSKRPARPPQSKVPSKPARRSASRSHSRSRSHGTVIPCSARNSSRVRHSRPTARPGRSGTGPTRARGARAGAGRGARSPPRW